MADNSQTRTAAIMEAVRKQLEARRGFLDLAEDLGQVTLTIKMQAGTTWVRGVIWEEERLMRSRTEPPYARKER